MSAPQTQTSFLNNEDIAYVLELAHQAGEMALEMREGVGIKEKTGPNDRVTEADIALSKLITDGLSKRFSEDEIISEEDSQHRKCEGKTRVWLVDPIDGTHNYIVNDGQYSVMIGLISDNEPVFGFVYAPALKLTLYGGVKYGAWKIIGDNKPVKFSVEDKLLVHNPKRLMIGSRDIKTHPWILELDAAVDRTKSSVGLKLKKIFDDQSDIYVHLSGNLKVWDTAAPAAIAIAAGLEVGRLEQDGLPYNLNNVQHNSSVIIGRPGSLKWARQHIQKPS